MGLNPMILRQVRLRVSAIPTPQISPPLPRSGFVQEPTAVDAMGQNPRAIVADARMGVLADSGHKLRVWFGTENGPSQDGRVPETTSVNIDYSHGVAIRGKAFAKCDSRADDFGFAPFLREASRTK